MKLLNRTNICDLLYVRQKGFNVKQKLIELGFSKAEDDLISKSINSEECKLKKVNTLPDNLRSTFSIEFSNDGKFVATSHSCRIVFVCDAFTLVEKYKIITDRTVWSMNFHPYINTILAVGTVKSKVYIYKNGVIHRKYVGLAITDDENLTPIASMQFHPDTLFLLFSNRNQIFWYDWENDTILKVISALPDTVVRFIKFIPGNSNCLLTSTTKAIIKSKLHLKADEAFDNNDPHELLNIFLVIANFVLETTEQYKSGNSRSWSYSIGIQYFIKLFYQVIDLMERIPLDVERSQGINLEFTLNCMRERINVIKMYSMDSLDSSSGARSLDFFRYFEVDLTIASNVINKIEFLFKNFEEEKQSKISIDDLYLEYEKAVWKDGSNMPRWPKIYYVQYWDMERGDEINLENCYHNLLAISADTTISVTSNFIVDFNPLLLTIEVISIRSENFGQRTHVLKNFPSFYYFFSVSPSRHNLLIGFKKGLPGYLFETYAIFYDLTGKNENTNNPKNFRTLKTNKNWDLNCLEFAPHPNAGIIFGYNGPLLYRLIK
uniref:CSON007322 protein n=1 Tax=Culicoides sonorensis TaxID=179676 RepID=A0A336M1H4_CULSO